MVFHASQLGLKFGAYVTLPALALQLLSVPGVAGPQALTIVVVSAAFSLLLALVSWYSPRSRCNCR